MPLAKTNKSIQQSIMTSQAFLQPLKPASKSNARQIDQPLTEEATKGGQPTQTQSASTTQQIGLITSSTKPPLSGPEKAPEGKKRGMENGRRQINRGNPELSYAYGAQSDKRKRRSVFDHNANRSTETSPNLNEEHNGHDRESMERSEPSATPEPQDRYAILKRRKLEAQKKQGEEQQQEHSRIQIKSPRKGAQTVNRVDVVVADSPGRTKRASNIRHSIQSPKSRGLSQQEADVHSPPTSTHGVNSDGRSSSARHSQNLYDVTNSRNFLHGKLNSFYMDNDPDSIEEAEEDEVNEHVPSSLLLGAQRQSRDIIGSRTGLDSTISSGFHDTRQLDISQLQRQVDDLAGPEESSISGSVIDQSNSSLNKKNGGMFQGKGNHQNTKFASIEEEPVSGGEQSGPENSKHSHTPLKTKAPKVQHKSPLQDQKAAMPASSQTANSINTGSSKLLLLCAALLGAIFAVLLTAQKDLAKPLSPSSSNTTLGDKLLRQRIDTLEKRLKQSEKQAAKVDQRILDAKSVADMVTDSTKSLPEVMRLLRDKQNGQMKLDDQTLEKLKQVFVEKGKESPKLATAASLSWDTFQKANDKALRQYAKDAITGEISTGNSIITRAQFVTLLKQELDKAKIDMESKFNENAQEIQNEILAKVREQREMFERSGSWKKMQGGTSGGNLPANLESARSSIIELIEDALETYSADRIGERDYALYSSGGRIIPSFTSPTFGLRKRSSSPLAWFSKAPLLERIGAEGQPPVIALVPDVTPGMCWAFAGSEGTLGISLARRVLVSKITLEHTSPSISHDQSISAPRDVTVWGIVERPNDVKRLTEYRRKRSQIGVEDEEGEEDSILPAPIPPSDRHLLLSSFTYDVSASKMIQQFPISREAEQMNIPIAIVQMQIHSNHGKKDYTCLYRVRVHGNEWTLEDELQSQN